MRAAMRTASGATVWTFAGLLVAACGGGGDGDDAVAETDAASTTETSPVDDSVAPTTVAPSTSASSEAPEESDAVAVTLSGDGGPVGGPVDVTVTLSNGTDETVTVVRPDVIPNLIDLIVVDADDNRVAYGGPQVRLTPLTDEGFVELAPGESTEQRFDLAVDFDLTPGTYTVVAEHRNPANGSHEGGRALTYEPGEGPTSEPITIEVTE